MLLRKEYIIKFLLTGSLLFALFACGKDEDTTDAQITAIVNYLGSREYEETDDVYRYFENGDRDDRTSGPYAGSGDQVEFWFEGYVLASGLTIGGDGTRTAPFYTNRAEIIAGLAGMDTPLDDDYWSDEIKVARLGSSLIKGLRRGMEGAYQGDSVVIAFPSYLGYGNDPFGTVAGNSPLVFRIYLEKVNK